MKPGQITPPSNPPLPPLKPSCRTPKPSSTSPSTSSASTASWKKPWPSSNSSRLSAKSGNESNSIGPSRSTARPNNKASPTTRRPMGSFFRRKKSPRNGSAANGINPPTMPTGTKPASPETSPDEDIFSDLPPLGPCCSSALRPDRQERCARSSVGQVPDLLRTGDLRPANRSRAPRVKTKNLAQRKNLKISVTPSRTVALPDPRLLAPGSRPPHFQPRSTPSPHRVKQNSNRSKT